MQRAGRLALSVGFFLLLFSCGASSKRQVKIQEWVEESHQLKVLATTQMVGDAVAAVGGEAVALFTLIGEQLNPHTYQLVKGDDELLAVAELIFYSGLNLEHGASLHQYLQSEGKAISLGDSLLKTASTKERLLTYSNQFDPHIWMDLSLWAETIPVVVKALSSHKPELSEMFEKNGELLRQSYLKAHAELRNQLMAIPDSQRYLVTSHDAFNYFTKAYLATDQEQINGLWPERFHAPEGLAPDSQLSVANIQQIIDHLRRYRVHVVFPESNVSKLSLKKIVDSGEKLGMQIQIASSALYGDAMGPEGSSAATLIGMLQHNGNVIASYLKSS